jgi:hypothetical protein
VVERTDAALLVLEAALGTLQMAAGAVPGVAMPDHISQATTQPERVSDAWSAWRAAAASATPTPPTEAGDDVTATTSPRRTAAAAYAHYGFNGWFNSQRAMPHLSPAGLAETVLPTPLSRPPPVPSTSQLHPAYAELLSVAAWRAGVAPDALQRAVHSHERRLARVAAHARTAARAGLTAHV